MNKKSESSLSYIDLQDTMARYNSELLPFSRLDSLRETDCRWVRIECSKDETTLKVRFIDSGKGTGLSVRIIRGIVEQHSGKCFLDPASPHPTFVIQLPLRQPQKGAA